jgi:D-galactarolactone cycloisomerase
MDRLPLSAATARAAVGPTDPTLFPYDPPEWDVDVRAFPMREPLRVGASGHIVLSERPGMGYELAEERLAATRIG